MIRRAQRIAECLLLSLAALLALAVLAPACGFNPEPHPAGARDVSDGGQYQGESESEAESESEGGEGEGVGDDGGPADAGPDALDGGDAGPPDGGDAGPPDGGDAGPPDG